MPLAFGKLVSTLLTELNLASNYIEDDGAKAIAEALKVNPVLTNFPNASGTLRRTPKLCEIPMC